MKSGLLTGKVGLIMGIANDHSIAYGIAKALVDQGAKVILTYQGDTIKKRITPLAKSLKAKLLIPCDVTDPKSMDAAFKKIKSCTKKLDFVVHAIAFSDRNELKGKYIHTTAQNFSKTMLISCYSFTDVCKRASELMVDGGTCLTLSYLGSEKFIPNYNVMGVAKAALEASIRYLAFDLGEKNIRVNAISAGPIRTLASSGIEDFRQILGWVQNNSALNRNITIEDVGNTGLYLCSNLSQGVTGEIIHVDAGYHLNGLINPRTAHQSADLLATFKVPDK